MASQAVGWTPYAPRGCETKKARDQNPLAPQSYQHHTFHLLIIGPATVGSNTTVIGTILEFSFFFVTIFIVWDSIHGQDFQAPPACTNVLLATAKRSLPDSELGYNDSQNKLSNFSLPFVVRMKLVEIANYYCPEKQTKQGVAGYHCASGWPEVAGLAGPAGKCVLIRLYSCPHDWRLRGVLRGGRTRAVGVPGQTAAERPREGFSSFVCPS